MNCANSFYLNKEGDRDLNVLLTGNKSYKIRSGIFNNDSVVTAAILDRLLHPFETICIEGQSYRMKDPIEPA